MSGIKLQSWDWRAWPQTHGTVTNVFVQDLSLRLQPLVLVGKMESYQEIKPWQINRSSSKVLRRSIPGIPLIIVSFPITAVEGLGYSSNTYMVQTALGIMGQTYQPNMTVKEPTILESAMGNFVQPLVSMVWACSTGIDLPDESTGFYS